MGSRGGGRALGTENTCDRVPPRGGGGVGLACSGPHLHGSGIITVLMTS